LRCLKIGYELFNWEFFVQMPPTPPRPLLWGVIIFSPPVHFCWFFVWQMHQEEGSIYSLDTIDNGALLQKRWANPPTLSVWTQACLPYGPGNGKRGCTLVPRKSRDVRKTCLLLQLHLMDKVTARGPWLLERVTMYVTKTCLCLQLHIIHYVTARGPWLLERVTMYVTKTCLCLQLHIMDHVTARGPSTGY
jgi:hypothetical protein